MEGKKGINTGAQKPWLVDKRITLMTVYKQNLGSCMTSW